MSPAAAVEPTRTVVIQPVGGMWTKDPAAFIPDGTSPDMQNFQVINGVLRKRPGLSPFGTTMPGGQITGVYSAQALDGTRRLYATNFTHLYRYNATTTVWDQMTGPNLTGGGANLFSFEVSQDNLVFSQGVDNIMALPLANTVYAALSANSFPSKFLSRWNGRLYAAFTSEGGLLKAFRVRWPVNGDHTNWTGVGSGFVDLTDDVYQIRQIRKLLDYLAIHTEKGIFLASKTGSSVGPASFALVVKDVGLLSSFALRNYNSLQMLVGSDNFYAFNGSQLTPILDPVRTFVFSQLNSLAAANNFAIEVQDTQEWLAFLSVNPSSLPNVAWVYSWLRQIAYPWVFTGCQYTYAALHLADANTKISDLTGTIAAQTWTIGSTRQTSTFPAVLLGTSDGRIVKLNSSYLHDDVNGVDTPILCRWTSKDFTCLDIHSSFAKMQVTLTAVGVSFVDPGSAFTLSFYISNNQGQSWRGPYNLTMGGSVAGSIGDAEFTEQITGKRVRFKIENNTTNELPQISAFHVKLELAPQSLV